MLPVRTLHSSSSITDPANADVAGSDCAAILQAFLRAISTITHYEVTSEHLLVAIDSLRQNDGIIIEIDRVDHIGLVIERLVEQHVRVP